VFFSRINSCVILNYTANVFPLLIHLPNPECGKCSFYEKKRFGMHAVRNADAEELTALVEVSCFVQTRNVSLIQFEIE